MDIVLYRHHLGSYPAHCLPSRSQASLEHSGHCCAADQDPKRVFDQTAQAAGEDWVGPLTQ